MNTIFKQLRLSINNTNWINKFSMKISSNGMRNYQPGSLSLGQIFNQYCSQPQRPYILSFSHQVSKLMGQQQFYINSIGVNISNKGGTNGQDNHLFANMFSKMGNSNRSGKSSKKGSDYDRNYENDLGAWEGQNYKISQALCKLHRDGSKSPLKRISQQLNNQQKNRTGKVHHKSNFSSYNIINKNYDRNRGDLHQNPNVSAFNCKNIHGTEQSHQQQKLRYKNCQQIAAQSIKDMQGVKNIFSEIKEPINLLDLSFQNVERFLPEENKQPSIPNKLEGQIQVKDLEKVISAISIDRKTKHEEKNKKSLIESLASANIESINEGLQCKETVINAISQPIEAKIQQKKIILQNEYEHISNPYAKSENNQAIQIKNKQLPSNQKQKEQPAVASIKLTDEQVCKIISSRKKAISQSKNNSVYIKQKVDIRNLLDLSDLDIDALLKIEVKDQVKEEKVQQKPTPQQECLLECTPVEPQIPQLNYSFVPYYHLRRSPEDVLSDISSYNLYVPSNINSTKPTNSHVYQNRRLSEQSEQPSSLVFQLSANSNF